MYNIINALAKYMITCFKHSLLIVKGSYFTESQVTAVVVEFPTDWSGSGVCLVSPRTGTLS